MMTMTLCNQRFLKPTCYCLKLIGNISGQKTEKQTQLKYASDLNTVSLLLNGFKKILLRSSQTCVTRLFRVICTCSLGMDIQVLLVPAYK